MIIDYPSGFNITKFWNQFDNYTTWKAFPVQSDLKVIKEYPKPYKCKITLDLTASRKATYTIIFKIDLDAISWEEENSTIKLKYKDWLIRFNFSDIKNLKLKHSHNIQGSRRFVFLIQKSMEKGERLLIDPTIENLGASGNDMATQQVHQRKLAYAQGLFWAFYSDTTNMKYSTSSDGESWSTPTVIRACSYGQYFSIWYNSTHVAYVFGAYPQTTAIYFRLGKFNTDGTITWLAAEQTVIDGLNRIEEGVTITRNTYGEFFIAYQNGTAWFPPETFYLIKSTSQTSQDGVWYNHTGFPIVVNDTQKINRASLVALNDGDIYISGAYCYKNEWADKLYGFLWNETSDTLIQEGNISHCNIERGWTQSSVSYGDEIWVIFRDREYPHAVYVMNKTKGGSWSEPYYLGDMPRGSGPTITVTTDGQDFYGIWSRNHTIATESYADDMIVRHFKKGFGWYSGEVVLVTEDDRIHGIPSCCYVVEGKAGVLYTYGRNDQNNIKIKFVYGSTVVSYGGVTVTNADCGNWVFAEETYYDFKATYTMGQLAGEVDLDTAMISFTDGVNNITVKYDVSDDTWSIVKGDDLIRIKRGEYTGSGVNRYVTWKIYFENSILDKLNVDIYQYGNDSSGNSEGWLLTSEDAFNIYNLGGQAQLTSSGSAGRITGGDVFQVYVNDSSSSAEVIQYWKHLQHVHWFLTLARNQTEDMGAPWPSDAFNRVFYCFGIEYWDGNTWVRGRYLNVTVSTADLYDDNWIEWTIRWYKRGTLVKTDVLYSNWQADEEGNYQNAPNDAIARMYIDLWFNRANGSRMIGGRINPEYFGIIKKGWLWWTGCSPMMGNVTQSMFFDFLEDSNGGVISAKQLKLMRIWVKVEEKSLASPSYWYIGDIDLQEIKANAKTMEGVNTPIFVATKNLDMPVGGFLAPLYSAFSTLGDRIVKALTTATLAAWNGFISFLDTIGSWLGFPNLFSNLLTWIGTLGVWMISAFQNLITLLTYIYMVITGPFKYLFTEMGHFVITSINFWNKVYEIFTGEYAPAAAFAELFNELDWGPILEIVFMWWIAHLADVGFRKGTGAMWKEMNTVINLFAMVLQFFMTIATKTLTMIAQLVDMIPVVE